MPPLLQDKDTQAILDTLLSPLDNIRLRRRYIEEEWLRNYAAWQGWPTITHFIPLPDGSIRYFIPVARRAIERINARIVKLLMPSAKWFEVQPFDSSEQNAHEKAASVDSLFRYIIQKKMVYKPIISSLTRALQLYGFSGIYTSPKVMNDEVWPSQRVLDPYSFYIFPETAQDISEVSLIFEDIQVPYEVYAGMTNITDPDAGLALPLDASRLQAPQWPYHLVERLAYRGLTAPDDFKGGSTESGYLLEGDFVDRKNTIRGELTQRSKGFVDMSTVSFRLNGDWYNAWIVYNYLDNENASRRSLNQEVSRNPIMVKLNKLDGLPTYRWAVLRSLPGELYTNSMMDDIRVLQILANNQISQVEANRAVVAEPPVGVNVSEGTNRTQSYRYAPRAKWEVDGNPNEFLKNLDVKDTSAEGLRVWQVTMGLINSSAGSGTIAEGQPGRNMPRAGFAVNSLINLALSDIQDIADTVEQCLLTPALGDIWRVVSEYTPENQIFKIPGIAKESAKYIVKSEIAGDYQFSWMGTLQFQDANTRADRLMKFLEILANPQIAQILASQGKQVDLGALLDMIWMEGLGERGLREVIIPAPQGAQGADDGQAQVNQAQQQMLQQKMQMEGQKAQADLASQTQQAQLAQQKGQLDLKTQAQKSQLDLAQGQQKISAEKMKMLIQLISAKAKAQNTPSSTPKKGT